MLALVAHCALGSGRHLVATEWAAGRPPRFSNLAEVTIAFRAAGELAGHWAGAMASRAVQPPDLWPRPLPSSLAPAAPRLRDDVLGEAWYRDGLVRDAACVASHQRLLLDIGCPDLGDLCRRLADAAAGIARRICADPVTLVNRDVTDDNFLLAPDGGCRVLDWEDAAIAPAVHWFETLGDSDPTGTVPEGPAIDVALRAFSDGFGAGGGGSLTLETLSAAWRCWRACQVVFYLSDGVVRLTGGDSAQESFLQACAGTLPTATEEAMAVL